MATHVSTQRSFSLINTRIVHEERGWKLLYRMDDAGQHEFIALCVADSRRVWMGPISLAKAKEKLVSMLEAGAPFEVL